jgi:hypothetical protein
MTIKYGLGSLVLMVTQAWTLYGAVNYVPVSFRIPEENCFLHRTELKTQFFGFQVTVIGDETGIKSERQEEGRPLVTGKKGERYTLRVYNPLPVQVAVNLTVDGLNTISGAPVGLSDGAKWMIQPFSSIDIRGWQVGDEAARRFFFTEKPKSYAKWRSRNFKWDLSRNCGVIGAAFFWNKAELDQYYARLSEMQANKPIGLRDQIELPSPEKDILKGKLFEEKSSGSAGKKEAGTGMGERESHSTTWVDFHYDAGTYELSQAVVIYYELESPRPPQPQPFPMGYIYSPEMPL